MKYTLKGWSFKEWFFGNGKTIKELAKVLIPLVLGWIATSNPVWTSVSVILGKLVLDTLEYYIKE